MAFVLPVALGGSRKQLCALIDTGAEVNLVGETLLPSSVKENGLGPKVRGITGHELEFQGWVEFPMRLNDQRTINVIAAVVKNSCTLVLGMPFLRDHDAVISIRKAEIRLGARIYSMNTRSSLLVGSLSTVEANDDVKAILECFPEVCTKDAIGRTEVVQHEIKLTTSWPICDRPRKYALWQQEIMDAEISKMLDVGVIRPSQSPYAAAVVLAKKKSGEWRFCVDYKNLNEVTIKDKHPLPRIKDLIRTIKESRYFITLDLRAGYWQVKMREEDVPKTAFRTHRGLYEFIVMPFGLTNAPATFQRLMETLFGDYHWRGILLYLDDILIHSPSRKGALDLLEIVLGRLRVAGLTINPEKCEFFPREINYLGHLLSEEGMRPNPRKVEAIKALHRPSDIKGVQRILGMFTYYQDFIPHYASHCEPLIEILRDKKRFRWGSEQDKALQKLKDAFVDVVLTIPLIGDDFLLETDASDHAVSGNLSVMRDGRVFPVELSSHTLSKPQRKWPIREKEAYAIVWSLERFEEYLRGRTVRVHTDHQSLKWFLSCKKGKLARWAQKLAEFDLDIYHKKGSELVHVDCFSRNPEDDEPLRDRMAFSAMRNSISGGTRQARDHNSTADSDEESSTGGSAYFLSDEGEVHSSSDDDEENDSEDGEEPLSSSYKLDLPTLEEVRAHASDLSETAEISILEGVPHYRGAIFMPEDLRARVIAYFHSIATGHGGISKTISKIHKLFNWPHLQEDVRDYVQSCYTCKKIKPGLELHQGALRRNPETLPFEVIHMDLWGPLVDTEGNSRSVLTIIDKSTRWAAAILLESKESRNIVEKFISEWCCRYGFPSKVITDQEPCFKESNLQETYRQLGIKGVHTTVYHPQGNSPVETFHRTLKNNIMTILSHNRVLPMQEVIQWALFAYNSSVNQITLETPSYLVFGLDIALPPERDWQKLSDRTVRERLELLAQTRLTVMFRANEVSETMMNRSNDQRHLVRLHVGDLVLMRRSDYQLTRLSALSESNKLVPKWSTPCRVLQTNQHGTTALCWDPLNRSKHQVHIQNIRFLQVPTNASQREEWIEELQGEMRSIGTSVSSKRLRKRIEREILDWNPSLTGNISREQHLLASESISKKPRTASSHEVWFSLLDHLEL